jgi:hypothetical protein
MNAILNYDVSITPSKTQLLPGKKNDLEINSLKYRLKTMYIVGDIN